MSFKGMDRVSILTLEGRQIIPIIFGEYQRERFDRLKGQCDLVFKDGKFYLLCSIDLPDKAPIEVRDFVGVDMGVAKLVTTSDGQHVSGENVEAVRVKHFNTRRSLGRKMGSKKRQTRKNARRAMKRIGNKESRFKRHTNHVISKQLVIHAKDTGRGIVIEELTGIRDRTQFRRGQRAKMGGWAFDQLRRFIEYKGKLYGVPVVAVDPRNTSRTCSECGYCAKSNRKSQSEFVCGQCGHTANADLNAAINIARRGCINQPKVSQPSPTVAA
jgi:IS605 OrfB family transposase